MTRETVIRLAWAEGVWDSSNAHVVERARVDHAWAFTTFCGIVTSRTGVATGWSISSAEVACAACRAGLGDRRGDDGRRLLASEGVSHAAQLVLEVTSAQTTSRTSKTARWACKPAWRSGVLSTGATNCLACLARLRPS